MTRISLLLAALLTVLPTSAVHAQEEEVYHAVDEMPAIVGGLAALMDEIVYPEAAKDSLIEGRVIVQAVVSAEGSVTRATVLLGVHEALDAEAVRAVRTLTFIPGKVGGKPVAVELSIPIRFKLPDEDEVYVVIDTMPKLIGGLASWRKKIRYPDSCRRARTQGTVIVSFVVNEQGYVENPTVKQGIGGGCDEEAVRVVSDARFTPAMQQGKAVKVRMSIPIAFSLEPVRKRYLGD